MVPNAPSNDLSSKSPPPLPPFSAAVARNFAYPEFAQKKRGNYLFTGFRIFHGFVVCFGEQFTQPMAVISRSRLRERSRRDRKRACLLVELWRKLAPYPYPIANIIWLLFTRVFFCRPLISVAIHPSCSFAAATAAMLLAPKPQNFGYSKCRLITCFAEGGPAGSG